MTFQKFQCRLQSIDARWKLTCFNICTPLPHTKRYSKLFFHRNPKKKVIIFKKCDGVTFFCIVNNFSSQILVQNTIIIFKTFYFINKTINTELNKLKCVLKVLFLKRDGVTFSKFRCRLPSKEIRWELTRYNFCTPL